MAAAKKKATAAPTARTRVQVNVVDTAGTALHGVKIDLAPSSGAAQRGTTDVNPKKRTQGWLSRPVAPGDLTITATLAAFGPPLSSPAGPPSSSPPSSASPASSAPVNPTEGPVTQTVTIPATPPAITTVTVTMAQALPRVVVTVMDAKYNVPIIGAIVTLETATPFKGTTDLRGQLTTPYLPVASNAMIVARKDGYDEDFALGEGTGDDLRPRQPFALADADLSQARDVPVTVLMHPIWGRVTSHNIQVGGTTFVDWFNNTFRPNYSGTLHEIDPESAFNQVFDDFVPNVWDDPLSIDEFIAMFLVILNESTIPKKGTNFQSALELYNPPAVKYFYRYNPNGANRPAGKCLVRLGFLDPVADKALVKQWNNGPYPGPSGNVTEDALKECDYYKYRGRGIIQVTLHDNYLTTPLANALAAQGFAGDNAAAILDSTTNDDLDNLLTTNSTCYYALTRGWLNQSTRPNSFRAVNLPSGSSQNWAAFGHAVNAYGPYYVNNYPADCTALRAAMVAANPSFT